MHLSTHPISTRSPSELRPVSAFTGAMPHSRAAAELALLEPLCDCVYAVGEGAEMVEGAIERLTPWSV